MCASLPPFPSVLVKLKKFAYFAPYDKNNNKITAGLP